MPSQSGGDDPIDDGRWSALLTEQSRRHKRLFFMLANGVLDDPQGAEDACQIALMKAWVHRRRISNPDSLRGWISKVVVTESLAMARRWRTEGRAFTLKLLPESRSALVDGVAADEKSRLDEAELRDAVLAALERMTDETTRQVVVLRDMHAERGGAVAELLGLSEPEISRLLKAGRKELRELLAEFLAGTEPDA